MTVHTKKFQLEERRRQVASMLAQAMTEQEIADNLGVDRTTISRDVKVLRQTSLRFVYDLAHSDLAYQYQQCLNGIQEAKRKAWTIFYRLDQQPERPGAVKDSLLALKLTVDCNEAQFSLFKEGPAIMQIKRFEERLMHIESRKLNKLEKKYEDLTGERVYHYNFADEELEDIRGEHEALEDLEKDQPLIDHLGDYHIVPITKWKLSVGLETKIKVGRLFANYGEDYENLTIEEEEWFRLLKKRDKALGYDPRLDPNYKF